jgi:hypothetical protein
MESLVKYVLDEIRVIARAPLVFMTALLALAGAVWWAMDWRYSGVIANRDAEISALKTQRDEYKDRLSGVFPAGQPVQRHLTDEQKRKLIAGLSALAQDIPKIAVYAEASRESAKYAIEFIRVFKDSGIAPIGPISTIPDFAEEKGVLVGLIDLAKPSDLATKYIGVLRSADLNVGTTKWQATLPEIKADFDLYICGE